MPMNEKGHAITGPEYEQIKLKERITRALLEPDDVWLHDILRNKFMPTEDSLHIINAHIPTANIPLVDDAMPEVTKEVERARYMVFTRLERQAKDEALSQALRMLDPLQFILHCPSSMLKASTERVQIIRQVLNIYKSRSDADLDRSFLRKVMDSPTVAHITALMLGIENPMHAVKYAQSRPLKSVWEDLRSRFPSQEMNDKELLRYAKKALERGS